jgi:hypothetical protein
MIYYGGIKMIHKSDLKNKYVTFKDKDGRTRTERVVRVDGSYATVRHIITINGKTRKFPKHRIHKDQIIGRQFRKKGTEEIDWNRRK